MRTLVVANRKGGVGKTSCAVNLAAALADLGRSVLVIDLDSQRNASMCLGVAENEAICNVLEGSGDLQEAIQHTNTERVHCVPPHDRIDILDRIQGEGSLKGIELRDALGRIDGYDFAIIDTPPGLGKLSTSGLVAANEVIAPIEPHPLSVAGLSKLIQLFDWVRDNLNPGLKFGGVLMSRVDRRYNLSDQVPEALAERFGGRIPLYDTQITYNAAIAKAPLEGKTAIAYAPDSRGAKDFMKLAKEIDSNG